MSATSSVGPLTQPKIHTLQVSSHGLADNDCETRGLEYTVELQEIAPGLLAIPEFTCANCGTQLKTELASE
jgi:hypothetical protein